MIEINASPNKKKMRNPEIRKKQHNTVMKYSLTTAKKSGSVTLILKTYLEANTLHFSSTLWGNHFEMKMDDQFLSAEG